MKLFRATLVVLFFLTLCSGGWAMIQTLSLEDLVIEADVIGMATLKVINKGKADKNLGTKVENTIVLSEVWKGGVKVNSEAVIETIEGMEDQPIFDPKGKFIVFLKKVPDSERYQTVNLIQGCWPLDKEGKPMGMGLGTSIEKIKEVIQKTAGQKPKPQEPPKPEF